MTHPPPEERTAAALLGVGIAPGLVGSLIALVALTEQTPWWWSVAALTGVCGSMVLLALTALGRVRARLGATCHLVTLTLAMLTLRLVSDMTYTESARPWLEPLVPSAVAAGALVSRAWPGAVAAGLVPLLVHVWLQLRADWDITVTRVATDAFFNLTVLAIMSALVLALVGAQARLQSEASIAAASYVRARTTEQLSRHNARWDALIHDQVLAALETVARAETAEEARRTARTAATYLAEGPSQGALDAVSLREELLQAVLSTYPLAETRFPAADDKQAVPVPGQVSHALVTGISEALRNAAAHAYRDEPGPVVVELVHTADDVRLCVQDSGRGFRREQIPITSFGVALSIENRMDAVGGRGVVTSTPGTGTKVELSWSRERRR